jgi:hypothetical protein
MAIIPLFAMVNHISAASRKEYESAPVGFGIIAVGWSRGQRMPIARAALPDLDEPSELRFPIG